MTPENQAKLLEAYRQDLRDMDAGTYRAPLPCPAFVMQSDDKHAIEYSCIWRGIGVFKALPVRACGPEDA